MAISQTATGTQGADWANPVIMDFDCAGGDLLVLGITGLSNPRVGDAPTYNGVAMTDSGQGIVDSTGQSIAEMWYLPDPPAGEHTISIPNTSQYWLIPLVSAWSGVDTGDPLDISESDFNAGSANPSVAITTSAADKLIIDVMMSSNENLPSANSHTLIFSLPWNTTTSNVQYTLDDGSSGITLDWTVAPSEDWAMIVCAFNPEGVAPPTRRVFLIT